MIYFVQTLFAKCAEIRNATGIYAKATWDSDSL